MKIGISAKGKTLDSDLDPRFGRAVCFIIFDTETNMMEVYDNEAAQAAGGAGGKAAQFMADHNVEVVISGNFGPNATTALNAFGIAMYQSEPQIISEAVSAYQSGQLIQVSQATVNGKHG